MRIGAIQLTSNCNFLKTEIKIIFEDQDSLSLCPIVHVTIEDVSNPEDQVYRVPFLLVTRALVLKLILRWWDFWLNLERKMPRKIVPRNVDQKMPRRMRKTPSGHFAMGYLVPYPIVWAVSKARRMALVIS